MESGKDQGLRVCLFAPLPPPNGGIATWTRLVLSHSKDVPGIALRVVDIAPRWRESYQVSLLRRSVGGALQFARDLVIAVVTIVRWHPDILHVTTSGQLGLLRDFGIAVLGRAFQIPVAYHIRFGRTPMLAGGRSWEWRLMRSVIRRISTVVAIDSPTELAIKHAEPGARVIRIPNGIEIGQLRPIEQEDSATRDVLFLGWVVPAKGVEDLLAAWSRVKRAGWRLVVAGPISRSYQESLQVRFNEAGAQFLGSLSHSQAMDVLSAATIFVLPSHTEGFPNVILEAMAHGKPIVATTVGAIPDMLDAGSGVLVRPADVADLERALGRLMADDTLRIETARRARERLQKHYGIDRVFEQYLAEWRDMARRNGAGRVA